VVSGTTSHLLPDALGSALALADSAGAVQTAYTYEPFGRTTVTGASNTNPFQYIGRENDATGLYYYRGRYYHPLIQRFISEDPVEFEGGDMNLYAYVLNNPLLYVDPFGLTHDTIPGGCMNPTASCRRPPPGREPPKSKSGDPQNPEANRDPRCAHCPPEISPRGCTAAQGICDSRGNFNPREQPESTLERLGRSLTEIEKLILRWVIGPRTGSPDE
jgi:RHS repeat-associated protein